MLKTTQKSILLVAASLAVMTTVPAVSLAAGTGQAGKAPELSARDQISRAVRMAMRSPFGPERIKAIRALGAQSDKGLVDEFKVLELLVSIAKEGRRLAVERAEALDALVNLYRKGIGSPTTLELLVGIVDDDGKGSSKSVRMKALLLIAEMAGSSTDDERVAHKAFSALERIWKNRSRSKVPSRMLAAVIETVGGFPDNDRAMSMLQDGLEDKSAIIRAGAQRGLQRYLQKAEKINKRLATKIFRLFSKSKNTNERVALIMVIDQMVMIDPSIIKSAKKIQNKLVSLLQAEGGYGSNAEVKAAVRVLLQIADDKIVDALLAAGRPDKSRKWSFTTYETISDALIEVVNKLRTNPRKGANTADKIAGHYLWLLNPKWLEGDPKKKGDFVRLVRSAIISLGMWPIDFDRKKIVVGLIKALKTVGENNWTEMIGECENSLKHLTAVPIPYKMTIKAREMPDIEKWKEWYRKNEKWLEAGKDPLDAED